MCLSKYLLNKLSNSGDSDLFEIYLYSFSAVVSTGVQVYVSQDESQSRV